jgi:hypothetical protein
VGLDTVVGSNVCTLTVGLVGPSSHVFASVYCGMLSEVGAHEQVLGESYTLLTSSVTALLVCSSASHTFMLIGVSCLQHA